MSLSIPHLIGVSGSEPTTSATTSARPGTTAVSDRPVLALLVLECPPNGCDFLQLAYSLKTAFGVWAALVAYRGRLYGATGPNETFGCSTGNQLVGERAWAAFYEVVERELRESGDLNAAVMTALPAFGGVS